MIEIRVIYEQSGSAQQPKYEIEKDLTRVPNISIEVVDWRIFHPPIDRFVNRRNWHTQSCEVEHVDNSSITWI